MLLNLFRLYDDKAIDMNDMVNDVFGQRTQTSAGGNVTGDDFSSTQIKIVTCGFGGAGCNIVNRLIKVGVKGTDFVAVNTDAQHFKIIDDRIKKILDRKDPDKGSGCRRRRQHGRQGSGGRQEPSGVGIR